MAIRQGYGQFYDSPAGMRRLALEIHEMQYFPFRADFCQDDGTGQVSWDLYILSNGITHKMNVAYDRRHPDYEMIAAIEYPRLDRSRMVNWIGDDRPCYTSSWSRDWTALKVATQLVFWLDDYYRGTYDCMRGMPDFDSMFRRMFP